MTGCELLEWCSRAADAVAREDRVVCIGSPAPTPNSTMPRWRVWIEDSESEMVGQQYDGETLEQALSALQVGLIAELKEVADLLKEALGGSTT